MCNIISMIAIAFFKRKTRIMSRFPFCSGFCEGDVASRKRAVPSLEESGSSYVPTKVGAKWSLEKNRLDSTDFIAVGVDCREHRGHDSRDDRWHQINDARKIVGLETRTEIVYQGRI